MDRRRALAQTRTPRLSIRQKCEILGIHRSGLYYESRPCKNDEVEVMNQIQDIYGLRPFLGYRRITYFLREEGFMINRKRVLRLLQEMGLQAVYPKINLSKRRMDHKVYPYLLKERPPLAPNDIWQVDITYIRLSGGFVYLVALIDVISRRVMGWDLSPFLETSSALKALEMALVSGYKPKIINSDQGCQFTSDIWAQTLTSHQIEISMDGKGRCLDNIYIEHFWRTIKYEEVYLKSYETVSIARLEIGEYILWYNKKRPHQSLSNKTPDSVFMYLVKSVESGDNSLSYPPLPTDTTTTTENSLLLEESTTLLSSQNAA